MYVHVCMYVCMNMYVQYIFMYVCMYVCMYVYFLPPPERGFQGVFGLLALARSVSCGALEVANHNQRAMCADSEMFQRHIYVHTYIHTYIHTQTCDHFK